MSEHDAEGRVLLAEDSDLRDDVQLLSFWPTSAMPSPRLLKTFPTSLELTLPAFLRPSTEACVPSCSLVPDHLAAPSRPAPAFLSASVASLPDFWLCSAVACQALASEWSTWA